MPKRQIDINLDFAKKDMSLKFEVKQFDNIILNVNCFKNGIAYDVSNASASLFVGCSNDVFKQEEGIVVNGTSISITVDKNMISKSGIAYAELELTDSNGTITSSTFIFKVEDKVGEGISIVGGVEGFIEIHERLIKEFKKEQKEVINTINSDIETLNKTVSNIISQGFGGGGINPVAKALLIEILKNAVYTSDQSQNIKELENSLSNSNSNNNDNIELLQGVLTINSLYNTPVLNENVLTII